MANIEQSFYGMKGQAIRRMREAGYGCIAIHRDKSDDPECVDGMFLQEDGDGFVRFGMTGGECSTTVEGVVRYISDFERGYGRKCDRKRALQMAIDTMRKELEKIK